MNLITNPCRRCGKPVATVTAAMGQVVTLEPAARIWEQASDGDGGRVWVPMPDQVVVAEHVCATERTGGQQP